MLISSEQLGSLYMDDIQKIDTVFGESPRHDGFWWSRGEENEGELRLFYNSFRGKTVAVIDGPTGAGKSSLIFKSLSDYSVDYNLVVCDHDLDWKEFCRQIISIPKPTKTVDEHRLGFSVKRFLPGGAIDARHAETHDPLMDIEFSEKYLEKISITDIAKMIINENVSLIVDDFEKSNKQLTKKMANLAKILSTLDHTSSKSKLVFISCENSFSEIVNVDKTLSKRILHMTLGGLSDPSHDWRFIQRGLEELGIKYPGQLGEPRDDEYVRLCQDYTYDSSGGNLKSLTDLGRRAALSSTKGNILRAKPYSEIAKKVAQKNIDEYTRKYSKITNTINGCNYVKSILSYLYNKGLTKPHRVSDIEYYFEKDRDFSLFPEALNILIQSGLVVATGAGQSTLFVSDPDFTLAFCVAVEKGAIYRIPERLKKFSPNLNLEFDHDTSNANKTFQRTSG